MPDPDPTATSAAARIVADTLRVDAATSEVLRAFDAEGIESRLLKGASIARWLYDATDPRYYTDCDLLVRPAEVPVAGEILARLGFEPEVDERAMPDWWREHAVGWLRREDSAVVDLHRTLSGLAASDELVWQVLSRDAGTVRVAGFPARTLSRAGRLLTIALHAAQHGPHWGGTVMSDLVRGLDRAGESEWRAAADLAAELGATPAFAAGLRLSPQGVRLAELLALPEEVPADVALRAGGDVPPVALGFEQLARARGTRARVRIVVRKAVPPPTFMRAWSPVARRGRVGLAAAYLMRPMWLVAHAPSGFRAWRSARRGARR